MSEALDLIRAVLAEDCLDNDCARRVLEAALEEEVDPLLHCSIAHAIDEALVMERAARWAALAFYPRVPLGSHGHVEPTRLEALAEVRLFRMQVLDREIAFAAPDFFGLLKLKRRLVTMPGLRRRICLVPNGALRDYLTSAAAGALIVGARQGLARRWPYASAQLELTAPARYSFVAGIVLLLAMILLAPHFAEAWLLPFSAFVLVGPAAIRLAAVATPARVETQPYRPPDAELPIYSVLVPLHNEAAMVPQLFEAMLALHYPALCIKRTKTGSAADVARSVGGDSSMLQCSGRPRAWSGKGNPLAQRLPADGQHMR